MLIRFTFLMIFLSFIGHLHAQINTPAGATIPFGSNTSYEFGMMPTNLPTSGTYGASQHAADAYTQWKADFIVNCGADAARVKFDQPTHTVSEGVAYAMLLAAYAADQDLLDRLWQYYKNHRNVNGVMHWKISGCNTVDQQNGATDAEVDAAMALIIADCQWGATGGHPYKSDAVTLLGKIKQHEVGVDKTFKNGDMWNPDNGNGLKCRNPSYQAPAYARYWSEWLAENGLPDSGFWSQVATATETLFVNSSNSYPSGLSSNWSNTTGAADSGCNGSGTGAFTFGYDASRAPWRQG